jgi:gas vesicle protein
MTGKGSKLFFAGIAGLLAGAAIGILFAPARGSKTRKRLKKGLRELADADGAEFSEKLKSITSIFSSKEEDEEEAGKEDAEKR